MLLRARRGEARGANERREPRAQELHIHGSGTEARLANARNTDEGAFMVVACGGKGLRRRCGLGGETRTAALMALAPAGRTSYLIADHADPRCIYTSIRMNVQPSRPVLRVLVDFQV